MARKSFSQDIFFNGLSLAITKFSSLIIVLAISNLFPEDALGAYALFLSIVMLFTGFTDFGVFGSVTIYAPKVSDLAERAVLVKRTLKIRALINIALAAVIILFGGFFAELVHLPASSATIMPILGVTIFAQATIDTILGLFTINRENNKIAQTNFMLNATKLVLIILIGISVKSVTMVFYALMAATIIIAAVTALLNRKELKRILVSKAELTHATRKEFIHYWKNSLVGLVTSPIVSSADYLIITIFNPNLYLLGLYQLALGVYAAILSFISFSSGIQTGTSELAREQYKALFSRLVKYSLLIAVPSVVLVNTILIHILNFAFMKHAAAIGLIQIYSIVLPIAPITVISTIFFNAAKKPQMATKVNILKVVTLIAGFLIAIPIFGIYGAVYSGIICEAVAFVYAMKLLRGVFRTEIDIKSIFWIVFASAALFIIIAASESYWIAGTIIGALAFLFIVIKSGTITIKEITNIYRKILHK